MIMFKNTSNSLPKSVRYTMGISGVLAVCIATVLSLDVGLSNAKAGNYQLSAVNCQVSKAVDSAECDHLKKFGVSPKLYLEDDNYRKAIDAQYQKQIEENAYIAPKVAQFTLDHAFKKQITLSVELAEYLQELSKD